MGLTEALVELGFETDRLKTGTPARVDSRSVDFSGLERQPGDEDVKWFSFDPEVGFAFDTNPGSPHHDLRGGQPLTLFALSPSALFHA